MRIVSINGWTVDLSKIVAFNYGPENPQSTLRPLTMCYRIYTDSTQCIIVSESAGEGILEAYYDYLGCKINDQVTQRP